MSGGATGWAAASGTPESPAQPERSGPDVLIASFDARSTAKKRDVSARLEHDLAQALARSGLKDITIGTSPQVVASSAEAQVAANSTGARVVIWGGYDDARILVHVLLTAGSGSASDRSWASRIPLALGGGSSAEITFRVADIRPEDVSFLSLFISGHMAFLSHNYEAGHAVFDAAMDNIPGDLKLEDAALVYFFLARQMDAPGADMSDVICEYARAIELEPDFAMAYNNLGTVLSRFMGLESLGTESRPGLTSRPSARADRCLEAAGLTPDEFSDPRDFYRRALEVDPDLTLAAFNLAVLEWQTAGAASGEARSPFLPVFEEFQRRDPSIVESYVIQSILLEDHGEGPAAVQKLEQGLTVHPSDSRLHFLLGQLYLRYERDEGLAEREFLVALQSNPYEAEARLALANLYFGQKRLPDASVQLEPILRSRNSMPAVDSVEWAARILESGIHFRQGNSAAAIQVLNEALPGDGPMPFASFLLGLLYQSGGRTEQAIASFERVTPARGASTQRYDGSWHLWADLVGKCFRVEVPASGKVSRLPAADCLPAADDQRITAVYDVFHAVLIDRRLIREPASLRAE